MSAKREWDLASKHSLEAAAEWLRKKAGALEVIVIRVEDEVIACDPSLAPRDAMERLLLSASDLTRQLNDKRVAQKEKKGK